MAVTAKQTSSTLRMVFSDGIDPISGKEIYKTKSFSNTKIAATTEQLFAVAVSLAPLQQRSLFKIERNDNSELRDEA
ncbi:hypothetical protein CFK37_08790 [Virgibacillus phasianinus]|uniref:DUF1659 domain-containing protein n=1 Tax=Virgibacillus phasianinus TaxID=2017483 RepID=A0A220U2D2_9BACI|nr:DUF1659 domain-containing protein [Virgibacillus phasianinus]ASK62250.1 hypothetical protein CFK37_08790 [Virgibacillus phasianinus]